VPLRKLTLPASRLWLAIAGLLVVTLLFPGLVPNGVNRLFQPTHDIPAYNLTRLDVSWSPAEPEVGDDVGITVRTAGLEPAGVELHVLDAHGNAIDRFAMIAEDATTYTSRLRTLREALRFTCVVNGRRSRVFTITPKPKAPAPADADKPTPEDQPVADGRTVRRESQTDDAGAGAIAERFEALRDRLTDLAEQLEATSPGDAAALQELQDAIASVLKDAESLSDQAEALAGDGTPAGLADALREMAQRLSNMSLASAPAPPAAEASPVDPAAADRWLDQAAEAAERDEQSVAQGLGTIASATDSGTSNREGPDAQRMPGEPSAGGQYEADLGRIDSGNLPAATLRQVPARYRNHVAAYFRQLAEDPPTPEQP
jgi:uncharacterized protein YjeT (DUF2065 family)